MVTASCCLWWSGKQLRYCGGRLLGDSGSSASVTNGFQMCQGEVVAGGLGGGCWQWWLWWVGSRLEGVCQSKQSIILQSSPLSVG